jgi:hypothetical protein
MSKNIKNVLRDIVKHTHGLGLFELVKVKGENGDTLIETISEGNTVILKGKMLAEVDDFTDQTVGLSRIGVLDGCLKYPGFDADGSSVTIETQQRNGADIPAEVAFKAADGTDAHYRFQLKETIDAQLKDIPFKGATYEVNIEPSVKNLKDLAYFSGILGSYEADFSPKTIDGKLYFNIGDGACDRTQILINETPDGDITSDMKWPLDITLRILKLSEAADVVLSINNQSLLQITVISSLGVYTYLLPAKS